MFQQICLISCIKKSPTKVGDFKFYKSSISPKTVLVI